MSLINEEIRKIVAKEENVIPFLQAGRLVHIKTGKQDWGWGIVAGF